MGPGFKHWLRLIAAVTVVAFSWYCIEPWNYLAWAQSRTKADVGAQAPASTKPQSTPSPAGLFEETLRATQKLIEDLDQEVAQDKNITLTLEALKGHQQTLEGADSEIKGGFSATEAFLKEKKLPAEILDRHAKAVADYDSNYKKLKGNLDGIISLEAERKDAEAKNNRSLAESKRGDLKGKIKAAKNHLTAKVKKPRHQPLDPNNLPHRTPKVKERKPRLKPEEFTEFNKPIQLAYNGELIDLKLVSHTPTDLPTAADLAETIEVQFTPEIQAKAAELGHNPVKIYNWVRNNIDFTPTWGSIQGANHCLLTKQCNAFDTASLLIALLRTSGISARYVMGTIELPIDQVKNWVSGFTDSTAALNFMASGGIAVAGGITGGKITTARIEHVWLEAYVDYIPYRGAVDGPGDTWVPLDPSFKQYSFTEGIDVDTAVPIDVDALLVEAQSQTIVDATIPSVTGLPATVVQTQIGDFQTTLENYLVASFPQVNTFREVSETLHGTKAIIQKALRFLPNTLPVKLITQGGTFSEVPGNLRHRITFKLTTPDLIFQGTSFSYTADLPAIAGKRMTLSYIPATAADANVMSQAAAIVGFPLYLVKVIPQLKIEGEVVASGSVIGMGLDQTLEMAFDSPSGIDDQISNVIHAGEYYGIGLDVSRVTFPYLKGRVDQWQPDIAEDRDDRIGELLFLVGMFYFANSEFFMNEAGKASDIVTLRHPSESMVGLRLDPSYLFGIPTRVASVSLGIDVDRDLISPASKSNSSDPKLWFMVQNGLYSSGQEHDLFESLMGLEATSTVRFLDLANTQQVPIYILDSSNSQRVGELQIPAQDQQDIRNAINAGLTVLVPKTQLQHFDYTGIGYIALDTTTGAGAYRISGGFNGGETVGENVEALLKLAGELIDKEAAVRPYQITLTNLLQDNPDIADSSNEEFKEFTEWMLYWGNFAQDIPYENLKVVIGQMILYFTEVMLTVIVTQP